MLIIKGVSMEKWFRLVGRFEGLSFLALLCVAMPLKYILNESFGVRLLGPVHGFLFLAYCACATLCALEYSWSGKKHFLAYIAAIIPGGTFWFERAYLTREKLS
jgi:integral membrane protein